MLPAAGALTSTAAKTYLPLLLCLLSWLLPQPLLWEQDGAALAKASCLWQVNEPLPALSAEPALAEALLEEASGLQALLRSADLAVQELLAGQQQAVISGLAPAQRLQVCVLCCTHVACWLCSVVCARACHTQAR